MAMLPERGRVPSMATSGLPSGKVLVVDDERANIEVLTRMMTREGYEVISASNGELALAAVARYRPDLVLMDVNMPVVNGFEACRQLKRETATRLLPVILLTGLAATEDRLRGIEAGADDFLSKPFAVDELRARVRSLTRLKRYTDELESAESVILSLALTIEARDPCTGGHCERLARYAVALGAQLGLDEEQQIALHRGGFLHDVGKVGIPDAVLLKAGALTEAEALLMRQHPIIGDALCGQMRSLQAVRPIVRHHHERQDGSGYPDGLRGDAIPWLAAVISVVDSYDAMTTERPYKRAKTPDQACAELRDEARKGWKHPTIVEALIDLELSGVLAR
ncbi:MAG TPA: HD domain-containing phosphohydrolase [Vicinamibacterales bacterium]|nr:HD domain-containing phosphohydrolase [Vicinamibacterales bacterium]